MRIAFTHNLQLSDSEVEAEFDTPETVSMILQALRKQGHEVEPVEVSGSASRVVARLEALSPDLVFNTAEGTHGRFREAFYPALFDRLGLPFTGSDAYVCALTLDKNLTKLVLAANGVPSPKGAVVESVGQVDALDLRFPVIAKPNYEGSSKGITMESVVEDMGALKALVVSLLGRFPAGVLVEEFIVGRDVVVPFLEKASPATGGVLEPAGYRFDEEVTADRKYQIYDFNLKQYESKHVHVDVPAQIEAEQRLQTLHRALIVFKRLGVRDVARIDFRIGDDGEVYFLEINALPSLEQGASIYTCGELAGLKTPEAVLECIVESAAERYGLPITRRSRRRREELTVGLTFNLRDPGRAPDNGTERMDEDAEFDTPDTIRSIRAAVESYGHRVMELEATPDLSAILPGAGVDVVFNIAEGLEGRAREAQVPAMLELLGIPYTGSDPTALSLALDKGLAKRIVRQAGFHTPDFMLMTTGKERLPKDLEYPVILKPVHEGSSKGVFGTSVVHNQEELRSLAREIAGRYRQAVLVERFLPGREFTVALLGEKRPRVLPPMEVVFTNPEDPNPVYSFTAKVEARNVRYDNPAQIDEGLKREIERVARGIFGVLGCRDFARIDFRLDEAGNVHFIECNPLPGLAPGFSDFCLIAEAAGMEYRVLVGEILAPAIRRFRHRRRERQLSDRLV